MNKVILIGHVGNDPVVREKAIAFSVATKERGYKKSDGTEVPERVQWHRITVFDPKIMGFVQNYIKKGSSLHIEGKIVYSTYTDANGVERQGVDIIADRVEFFYLGERKSSESES